MLTGLAAGALEEAVDYAKQRRQYGQAIGAFQAVQHVCAEMLYRVETTRSVMLGASWMIDNADLVDAERSAAAAKAYASRAAVRVCETAIQVLGGIGVTAEHGAHHRLRSAHTFAALFGGAAASLDQLATAASTWS
jgi:alkylation response protein AidB-like acyl-CoA dehydrogenase